MLFSPHFSLLCSFTRTYSKLLVKYFVCFLHVRVVYNATKAAVVCRENFFIFRLAGFHRCFFYSRSTPLPPPSPPSTAIVIVAVAIPPPPSNHSASPLATPSPWCPPVPLLWVCDCVSWNELHRSKVFFLFFFCCLLFFPLFFFVEAIRCCAFHFHSCFSALLRTQQGLFLLPPAPRPASLSIFFVFRAPPFGGWPSTPVGDGSRGRFIATWLRLLPHFDHFFGKRKLCGGVASERGRRLG